MEDEEEVEVEVLEVVVRGFEEVDFGRRGERFRGEEGGEGVLRRELVRARSPRTGAVVVMVEVVDFDDFPFAVVVGRGARVSSASLSE